MKGEFPLVKLSEYQEAATVEELDSKKYGVDEVLNEVLADLNTMKKLATEIRNDADQAGDFKVVGAFKDHVAGYSQNIWFVRSILA
jgi:starvation-inducible DNA-binding protein